MGESASGTSVRFIRGAVPPRTHPSPRLRSVQIASARRRRGAALGLRNGGNGVANGAGYTTVHQDQLDVRRGPPGTNFAPLANHAGAFGIEGPAGNEELHGGCVIAGVRGDAAVELVRLLDPIHVELDAEAGAVGNGNEASGDA